MTRLKLAVLLGFALAFAAGTSVGLLVSLPQPAEADPPRRSHDFARQLGLSDQQRDEMRRIWGETVMGKDRGFRDAKRQIWQEKDKAVEALLTDEQREQYDAILAECDLRLEEMDAQWQKVIDEAVEKTKAILTPEQIKKYEQFRAARRGRHSRGGRGRGPRGPGDQGKPHGPPPDGPNSPAGGR